MTARAAAGPGRPLGDEAAARPVLAASVAVIRADRVLLARRGRPPLASLWSLPGGHVEAGETLAAAALRELREETGVEAELIRFIAPIEYVDRHSDGRLRHHFVICAHAARWRSGDGATSPEASAVRWFREDEIEDVPTTPGLLPILRQALAVGRAGFGTTSLPSF